LVCTARATAINYIGANGTWSTAANWSPAQVPTSADDVTINASKVVSLDYTAEVKSLKIMNSAILSVAGAATTVLGRAPKDAARTAPVGITVTDNVTIFGSLAIGGLNQLCPSYLTVGGGLMLSNNLASAVLAIYAGITGPTNDVATYKTGGARVTVAGKTILGGTHASNVCTVYPYCHQTSGAPVVFDLQDLAVFARGTFNANEHGFGYVGTTFYGNGQGRGNSGGGGYGGKGGGPATTYGLTYGWPLAPYFPGSPGRIAQIARGLGGGAIRILARSVVFDGSLLADGWGWYAGTEATFGMSSGGGIWVSCTNFTAGATAVIRAQGGSPVRAGSVTEAGGGGGRVAILVNSPTAAQINSLYNTGTATGLIVMPMADSPYPNLVNVAAGINYYRTANAIDTLYNGQPGTAYWMINKGGDWQVEVSGDPVKTETALPAYGKHKIAGGSLAANVVSPGYVAGSGGNSRMMCGGYLWSNATSSVSGSATNVTINVTADTWLIWNWTNLQHRLTVRTGGYGTVAAPDAWQTNNAVCSLTATANAGCTFLYWVGDVAYADRMNATITLTMAGPRTAIACFAGPSPRSLSANAAAGGDWFHSNTWDGVAIPGPADSLAVSAVDLKIGYPAEITVGALTLASSAFLHVGGTGTDVLAQSPVTTAADKPVALTVTGNLMIQDTAKLALGGRDSAYRSFLTVNGDLWITNTAAVAAYAGYAGTISAVATYRTGGASVTVGGDTTLGSGTWIHPFCNRYGGAPVLFELSDLNIAANAGFNATGRGHAALGFDYRYTGLGNSPSISIGASYGGKGGGTAAPAAYGFRYAPYYAGSAGRASTTTYGMGGGSIRIAAWNIFIAGKLLAEGQPHSGADNSVGSGGSVWMTCSNLTASGGASISAKGGNCTAYTSSGAGGGGRVAIMTGGPTDEQLDSLYLTGTCDNLIVTSTNMSDALTSPYPTLANVQGGVNIEKQSDPTYYSHGKPGTAVWLLNRGVNRQIVVTGTPLQLGVATPGYGIGTLPMGQNTLSVTSPAFLPNTTDRSRVFCQSYVWSNATESVSGSGSSVAINITDDTWLTWLWGGTEHRLDVRSGGNGAVTENYSQWYAAGATCTLTAVPEPGCSFLYWVGDVPYADRFDAEVTLTMDRPRAVIACFTTGSGAARDLAWGGSIDDDWYNPANWDGTAIPGVYDTVSITNGNSRVNYPYEVTLASLTLSGTGKLFFGGSGSSASDCVPVNLTEARPYKLTISGNMVLADSAQLAMGGLNATSRVELAVGGNLAMRNTAQLALYAAYAGPTNALATYQDGGGRMTVQGLTMLTNTTWILPFCHMHSGAPVIFDLQDVHIAAGCGFNADWKGFGREARYSPALSWRYHGPGAGTSGIGSGWGGSYGGRGGGANNVIGCGYAYAPYLPGSAGRSALENAVRWGGGGAIRIKARNVQLLGVLKASGYGAYMYGGGSGGGIWVTCNRFEIGTGAQMNAAGGNASDYHMFGGGGGGRIAIGVKLSAAQLASLYATGTMRGLQALALADLPDFAAKVNVNGGPGQHNLPGDDVLYDGYPGTAVYVMGPPPGTLIILR
jgi:hypothetical protein